MDNTSFDFSRIGFGTANLGAQYGLIKNSSLSDPATNRLKCFDLLDRVFESGVHVLDTASHYGESELIISEYLKSNSSVKAKVISKFLPQNADKEIASSQERLGSHLFAMLWHNFEPSFLNQYQDKMVQLKRQLGPIRLGCSTYGPAAAQGALDSGLFDVIEIEYNCLNREVLNAVQSAAKKKDVKLVLRSILQKGFLTDLLLETKTVVHSDPAENEKLHVIGKTVRKLAQKYNQTTEELALRYAAATTESEIILIGANTPEQFTDNLKLLLKPKLDSSIIDELKSITESVSSHLFDLRKWKS